jgi:hypothetical protein
MADGRGARLDPDMRIKSRIAVSSYEISAHSSASALSTAAGDARDQIPLDLRGSLWFSTPFVMKLLRHQLSLLVPRTHRPGERRPSVLSERLPPRIIHNAAMPKCRTHLARKREHIL